MQSTMTTKVSNHGGARPGAGRKTAMDENAVANHFQLYKKAQAKKEAHRANIAEMEEKQMKGELIHVDDVKKQAIQSARAIREALLSLPSRLSAIIAEQPEPLVRELMDKEIRQILQTLADEHERLS